MLKLTLARALEPEWYVLSHTSYQATGSYVSFRTSAMALASFLEMNVSSIFGLVLHRKLTLSATSH